MTMKKKAVEKLDNFFVPKIYQVRFQNISPVKLEEYPELMKLGDWLSHNSPIWSCHSQLEKNEFEESFYQITNLSKNDVKIFYGGEGQNVFLPGWRQSVNMYGSNE